MINSLRAVKHTLVHAFRRITARKPKLRHGSLYCRLVKGKRGLEIGGPSEIFKRDGTLPIYPLAASIDNCNYTDQTLWEGEITAGATFVFDSSKSCGQQYIRD